MQAVLTEWQDERRRQFRRMIGASSMGHLVFLLFFVLSPFRPSMSTLPAVVRVDLVASAPAPAAVRPAPKPRKAPPPAAPKPVPKPEPKPKPAPVVEKKVLPKDPVAKPTPAPPPPAPAAKELDYEDVLAELRKNETETFPEAPTAAAPAARVGPAGGPGRLITPEEAAWRERARAYVLRSWVVAPGFRSQALVATVSVRLSPAGDVLEVRVAQPSGNPWYDESVERALQKASPLPAPPSYLEVVEFRFDPRDLR